MSKKYLNDIDLNGKLTIAGSGGTSGYFLRTDGSGVITWAASSISNSLVITSDSGTTEGTSQYTFNGSAAKTVNFASGTNIALTETVGTITVNVSTYIDQAYLTTVYR